MELKVDIEKELKGFTLKTKFSVSGHVMGLLGASGSGKTMTLRCIAGLEHPTRGNITLNDRILFDSEAKICVPAGKRKVGLLFQNYALFPHMTVAGNISFPLQGDAAAKNEKVNRLMAMMQLEGLESRYPAQLSGGQQQRVAFARALAIEPEILLLDEPFSALDHHLRRQMEDQLISILEQYKGTTLFVTHHMEEAYRVCQQLVIMSGGKIAAAGGRDEIFQYPPSLAAAQLTGCPNLSKAVLIEKGIVQATDWGCALQVDQSVTEPIAYVGIRPHHLVLAEEENAIPNAVDFYPVKWVKSPYFVTITGRLKKDIQEIEERAFIQIDLPQAQWEAVKDQKLPWKISLPPQHLFLMSC